MIQSQETAFSIGIVPRTCTILREEQRQEKQKWQVGVSGEVEETQVEAEARHDVVLARLLRLSAHATGTGGRAGEGGGGVGGV